MVLLFVGKLAHDLLNLGGHASPRSYQCSSPTKSFGAYAGFLAWRWFAVRDALAGMHGHNVEDLMNRVPGGDIAPMEALVSANSFAAEAIKMADQIGALAPELEADIGPAYTFQSIR